MGISAIIPVFNEERRLRTCLETYRWCDEIVVLDKESTDRTREIAAQYTNKILSMRNSESYSSIELTLLLEHCVNEWVIIVTASDIIHPLLAFQIKELASRLDLPYDVMEVPFHRYVLGVGSKASPWYSEYAQCVARKSVIQVKPFGVHDAVRMTSKRVLRLQKSQTVCIYHLTHETVDGMMQRHLRYWKAEAGNTSRVELKRSLRSILKLTVNLLVRRRNLFRGSAGIALSFAYLSYFLMKYVYQWEKRRGDHRAYETMRSDILRQWDSVQSSTNRPSTSMDSE